MFIDDMEKTKTIKMPHRHCTFNFESAFNLTELKQIVSFKKYAAVMPFFLKKRNLKQIFFRTNNNTHIDQRADSIEYVTNVNYTKYFLLDSSLNDQKTKPTIL